MRRPGIAGRPPTSLRYTMCVVPTPPCSAAIAPDAADVRAQSLCRALCAADRALSNCGTAKHNKGTSVKRQ